MVVKELRTCETGQVFYVGTRALQLIFKAKISVMMNFINFFGINPVQWGIGKMSCIFDSLRYNVIPFIKKVFHITGF